MKNWILKKAVEFVLCGFVIFSVCVFVPAILFKIFGL